MVKTLNTLVKITEYEIEEKRKALNKVLSEKESLVNNVKQLEEAYIEESNRLNNIEDVSLRAFLPRFLAHTREKQKLIINKIESLNPMIEKLTDELYEVFIENKKYEILRDQKLEDLKQELQKKTQLELDEIALIKFVNLDDS